MFASCRHVVTPPQEKTHLNLSHVSGEYAMHPLQRELRIKKAGIQVRREGIHGPSNRWLIYGYEHDITIYGYLWYVGIYGI